MGPGRVYERSQIAATGPDRALTVGADAALARVAEREDLTRIFTLDRRHFSVYRPGRRRRFSILPE